MKRGFTTPREKDNESSLSLFSNAGEVNYPAAELRGITNNYSSLCCGDRGSFLDKDAASAALVTWSIQPRSRASRHSGRPVKALRAFTMIEVLITVSIIAVVSLFTIGNGIDTNARADIASEHTTLLELLTHARNQAMNNVNQSPHGVHRDAASFILFEGGAYDPLNPANEATARNASVSVSGPTDIVFEQLSGRATPSAGSIVLSKAAYTRFITVNAEGRLDR